MTWIILALLIDPRGGEGIALLSFCMLASIGFMKLAEWLSNSTGEKIFTDSKTLVTFSCLITYYLFVSTIYDFQLVNTSLKSGDLEMIEWIQENVEDDKTFLLATGREFSMTDPLQEWFPALTNQYSRTTMQGLEWTLAENFFPYYEQLTVFQKCADVVCVNQWVVQNNVEYDYLIILIPTKDDTSELVDSLRSLGASVRTSALHILIFESEHALVFELDNNCRSRL
ncbi:MAG: hypothetical protein HC797_07535 [Anaerolineales bacterium]|nr:hypothetical protein [Anaerolineales bacterium]